jgi:DNA primase
MEIVTKQQKIDVLEGIFGESTLANSGKNISVMCPACKADSKSNSRKKKLSICLNKGIYHCWVCEAKGHNIAKFATRNTFVNKSDVATLNDLFSFDDSKEEKEPEYILRLPEDFCLLVNAPGRLAKIAMSYLHKRGLTQNDLLRYKIGISGEYEYNNRVIFPSFCNDMKLNYFLSRTYDDNQFRKYKNCQVQRSDIIFNEYLIKWDKPVILVEGVFDAIKAGNNAIPMLGSWIDEGHFLFKKIVNEKTPVTLGLDPDAIEKTMKIAKNLTSFGVDVKICEHIVSDFGDMTKEEAKYYIENAKKYDISDRITYLIKNISSGSIF